MAYYGYHRVSTKKQHEDRGVAEIEAFCKLKNIHLSSDVFCDKQTGKNFNRPEYIFIRGRIQPGDTLIITEMDRLGMMRFVKCYHFEAASGHKCK